MDLGSGIMKKKTRRDMDPFLNKFLSWLVVFSVIISLILLCVVLIDLNNIWKDLIEYQERIKNLEILTLRKIGVKIWQLIKSYLDEMEEKWV